MTIGSESLVHEIEITPKSIPSTPEHILWGNLGEPSSKAKYVVVTDSELVPRGKGEKLGETPDEIVSETVCEQTERVQFSWMISCLLKNEPASILIDASLTTLSVGRRRETESERATISAIWMARNQVI